MMNTRVCMRDDEIVVNTYFISIGTLSLLLFEGH
jgi:hypothetical protein